MTWQTIDTGPKDGHKVLIWSVHTQRLFPARWRPQSQSWHSEEAERDDPPTHWQEIELPPGWDPDFQEP